MRVESECLCVWVSNLKKSPIAVKVCIKLIRKWLIEGDSRIKWRTKAFSRTLTRSICVVWKLLGMHDRPWKGTHEKHGRTISQPWYCMLVTVRVSSRASYAESFPNKQRVINFLLDEIRNCNLIDIQSLLDMVDIIGDWKICSQNSNCSINRFFLFTILKEFIMDVNRIDSKFATYVDFIIIFTTNIHEIEYTL